MKRLLALLLVVSICFAGCGKNAKKREETPIDLPDGIAAENAEDFAVFGGELWILGDGEARTVGEEPEVLELPDGYVPAFLSAGETGSVLCSSDGAVLWDGETAVLSVPEEEPVLTSFAVAGDTAVAAYRHITDGWGEGNRLVFFNRRTHDCITANPVREGLCRVIPGDSESVWILNYGFADVGWTVYRYNLRTMQPELLAALSIGWDVRAAAYDPGQDALFLLETQTNGERSLTALEKLTPGEERPARLAAPENWGGEVTKMLFSAGQLVLMDGSGTVTVLSDWMPADDGRVVTIAVVPARDQGNFSHAENCAEKLVRLGGAVGISVDVFRLTGEQIRVKLLAGDSDFDLFSAGSDELYLDKPFWEPLDGYACITEQTVKLTDDTIRLSSWNGRLFGVPISGSLSNQFRRVNAENAALLGLTEAEMNGIGMTDGSWTIDDFYALGKRAKEKGLLVSQYFTLGMDDYAARYVTFEGGIGRLADENGDNLRHMLSLAKTMKDEGMTDDFAPADRALLNVRGGSEEVLDVRVRIPSFDGEPRYPVQIGYLVMNAASVHKEAAAEILGFAADPDNGLFPLAWSEFIPYRDAEERLASEIERNYGLDAYRDGETTIDIVPALDDEWLGYLDAYRDAEPYFVTVPAFNDEWLHYAGSEAWKYLNDEQDLDYTVKRILERAKMVLEG